MSHPRNQTAVRSDSRPELGPAAGLPDEPQPRTYSSFGIQRQLASVTKASDKRQIETERAQNAASVGSQEGHRNSPSLHTITRLDYTKKACNLPGSASAAVNPKLLALRMTPSAEAMVSHCLRTGRNFREQKMLRVQSRRRFCLWTLVGPSPSETWESQNTTSSYALALNAQ